MTSSQPSAFDPLKGWAARALRAALHAALSLFAKIEIVGSEHLPNGGGLLVGNHVGWADPLWIAYATYPKPLQQMAKAELFRFWPFAAVIRALGAFPVDRARPSPSTLKYAGKLLKQGSWLLIFPTGTRDQNQVEARRGAAAIASIGGAPIIPVHYRGPSAVRIAHLFKRPTITVRFGRPVEAPNGDRDRRSTVQLTEEIERAIHSLGPDRAP